MGLRITIQKQFNIWENMIPFIYPMFLYLKKAAASKEEWKEGELEEEFIFFNEVLSTV